MSSVWVQLYIKGENKPKGQPVEIEPLPRNINALKELVKVKVKPEIDHASLVKIDVYATIEDLNNATGIDPGRVVPTGTNSKEPLIVTAPPPPPPPPQQLWYNVYGTIERNRAVAGVRFKLIELASKNGYYPSGFAVENSFSVSEHPTDPQNGCSRCLLSFVIYPLRNNFKELLTVTSTRQEG